MIRTLDMFRLGGLKETGIDGISFDWENVKSNYMPFHGTPHVFKPEPDAPLGKFRTSQIGTGEGSKQHLGMVYILQINRRSRRSILHERESYLQYVKGEMRLQEYNELILREKVSQMEFMSGLKTKGKERDLDDNGIS